MLVLVIGTLVNMVDHELLQGVVDIVIEMLTVHIIKGGLEVIP